VLGCSGGIGGERRTMALLLDDDVLIDAGSGAGELSLEQMVKIRHVFLTHAHLDHSAFLPFIADAAVTRRKHPLQVYALPETLEALKQNMFNGQLWPDYTVLPNVDRPYIRLVPLAIGTPVRLGSRSITPLAVQHSVPAVGYCLDSGTASFVYTGDTTDCEELWAALNVIANLRYLMVEVTLRNGNDDAATRYGHLSATLLARGLASLRRPVQLLIAHLTPGEEEGIMAEIMTACSEFRPLRVEQGQQFVL